MQRAILRGRPPSIPPLATPSRLAAMLLLTKPRAATGSSAPAVRLGARVLDAVVAAGHARRVTRDVRDRAVVCAAVARGQHAVGARVDAAHAVGRRARPVQVAVARGGCGRGRVGGGAGDLGEAGWREAGVGVAEEGAGVLLLGLVAGRGVAAVDGTVGVVRVGAPGGAGGEGAAIWEEGWVVRWEAEW